MKLKALIATAALLTAGSANAGVFILDGTDAEDHGFVSSGVNQDGWAYIQAGLENIGTSSDLTLTHMTIAVLGADVGGNAANAVQSAFNLSSLAGSWTIHFLNDTEISEFFAGTGAVNTGNTSFIYIPTADRDTGGGINDAEEAILTANAIAIDNFLGAGGGLFSHAQSYGWLSALIPGATVTDVGSGGISGLTLTAAGQAEFPGLDPNDVANADPWHMFFTNFGSLPVLGVGPNQQAVIIGGSGGSITQPPSSAVPEPGTWAMMLMGFGAVGFTMRRRKRFMHYRAVPQIV